MHALTTKDAKEKAVSKDWRPFWTPGILPEPGARGIGFWRAAVPEVKPRICPGLEVLVQAGSQLRNRCLMVRVIGQIVAFVRVGGEIVKGVRKWVVGG